MKWDGYDWEAIATSAQIRIADLEKENETWWNANQEQLALQEKLERENAALQAALRQARELYQVTHIHAAIDAALAALEVEVQPQEKP